MPERGAPHPRLHASVEAQDYSPERIEILVAEGRSTDRTREILAELAHVDPRIRVVDNPDLLQSAGTNRLIRAAKGEIVVHYEPRGSFRELFRQYFRYGPGRARTLLEHGRFASVRPAVPFAGLVTAALLTALSPLPPFGAVALAALLGYLGLCAAEIARVGRSAGVDQLPTVFASPTLHVAHGAGFARGLWRYLRRPDW